jgi:hypothetical protein
MGVDHDLLLLPPSVLMDPTSPPGSVVRIGELDFTSIEGGVPYPLSLDPLDHLLASILSSN